MELIDPDWHCMRKIAIIFLSVSFNIRILVLKRTLSLRCFLVPTIYVLVEIFFL